MALVSTADRSTIKSCVYLASRVCVHCVSYNCWYPSPFGYPPLCSGSELVAVVFRHSRSRSRGRAEPAWHRRQRRERTEARTRLRGFLTNPAEAEGGRVEQAILCLQRHHSNSTLPQLAAQKLAETSGIQVDTHIDLPTGIMASDRQPWYCTHCWRLNKINAEFCGGCGQNWVKGYMHQQEWQQQNWAGPSSPRRRQNPVSPRQRQASTVGDGKGKSGQGKGKDKQGWQSFRAPKAAALPPAPKMNVPTMPVGIASATSSGGNGDSSAEKNLETLVMALQDASLDLPQSVRDLVRQHSDASSKVAAKSLHKAVNAQSSARQELRKIAEQRRTFLKSWAMYIATLTDTLSKQIQEQEAALVSYQEAEDAWSQYLRDATEDLARLAKGGNLAETKIEEDEAAMEEDDTSRSAQAQAVLERHREQQKSLMEQLTLATANAEALVKSTEREGSRTPRRTKGARIIPVDSSPESGTVPGKA